jgi:hypothetical protein
MAPVNRKDKEDSPLKKIMGPVISGVLISALTALGGYSNHLSQSIDTQRTEFNQRLADQKDEYDKTIAELRSQLASMERQLSGDESDISDLQHDGEIVKDAMGNRLTKLEADNNCNCKTKIK